MIKHGLGFKFENKDGGYYPSKRFRIVDPVTGEVEKINGQAYYHTIEDAVKVLESMKYTLYGRNLIEEIQCYEYVK
jgi:hypothetical protein